LRILLTNDDGINADGLAALREAIEGIEGAEVYVVAPDRERSATGHAITLHQPLHVEPVTFAGSRCRAWSVTGTPADCTKIAVEALMDGRPDIVLSGINRGPNLGTDVVYSGTVSAAIEAIILGIPAMAISLGAYENLNYEFAARFTRRLVERYFQWGLGEDVLLNVNVPAIEPELISGVAVTRLGTRRYTNIFDRRVDPRGRVYYWLAGEALDREAGADTDVGALQRNMVSITPIHLELTSHAAVERMRAIELDDLLES